MLPLPSKHFLWFIIFNVLHGNVAGWLNGPQHSSFQQGLCSTTTTTTTTALSLSSAPTPGGVYGKAKPENLIKQTDYLKNPRPKKSALPAAESKEPQPFNTYSDEEKLARFQQLLQRSLVSFNTTAVRDLNEELSSIRRQQGGDQILAGILGLLLAKGPDNSSNLPLWTKIRPLARFSERAKWASLRRTLDLTTPPPTAEDSDEAESAEDRMRRRRRALVTILRSLENDENNNNKEDGQRRLPAIRWLEKKSRLEKRGAIQSETLTSRRPVGLETPKYQVLQKISNACEVRVYSDYAVCSVNMNKPRPVDASKTDATVSDPSKGGAKAFGALAGYLFGKNEQQQSMKMTTPVLFSNNNDDEAEGKMMSFVLPSDYWDNKVGSAPAPLEGSGVTLTAVKGDTRATIMFGGYASKKAEEQQTKQLLSLLEEDKKWKVVEGESCVVAQYNDPFTPPWKRLNEVSVAVEAR
mmetsp:Transcript_14453/g.40102  ORF Transcript_14453/g.40102 Transcript_14453/m.40102 type:complete len:467 (+) Transcript_14453:56-1456(+)